MVLIPPLTLVEWRKSWRIIPSRFPPISLFERIAPPQDWEIIAEIEGLTNERLRNEVGDISLVSVEDRVSGPGAGFVMGAFTHLNPQGSRFSDGAFGIYYASHTLQTAIAETVFHREKFMRATGESPTHLDMRVLVATIQGTLHDIRGEPFSESPLYDKDSYSSARPFAKHLKEMNSNGLIYQSVRFPEGENVAIFKPKLVSNCLQERHLEYVWSGESISSVFEKKLVA